MATESKLENITKKDVSKQKENTKISHHSGSHSDSHEHKHHKKDHEGERRSLMDVINHALHETERATYLHRLTYVGRHTFKDTGEGSEELDSIFQACVNLVNESYCSEPLTGCFIYYSKHFIHIVEGAEDSIGHHVQLINEQIEKHGRYFGVIKIILQTHHIRRRYFGAWFSMYGVPRTLIEKMQGNAEDVIAQQIENFMKKIVAIASYLDKRDSEQEKSTGIYLNPKTLALLPETNLLDFILKVDCLETLKDFLKTYQHFPHLDLYENYCWPPIMDFVPYNLYIEIPEIPKLQVPSYLPVEEVEVRQRVKGYKSNTKTQDPKDKQKLLFDERRKTRSDEKKSEVDVTDENKDKSDLKSPDELHEGVEETDIGREIEQGSDFQKTDDTGEQNTEQTDRPETEHQEQLE